MGRSRSNINMLYNSYTVVSHLQCIHSAALLSMPHSRLILCLLLQKWMSAPGLTMGAVSSVVSTHSAVTSAPVTLVTSWLQTNEAARVSI